VVGAILITTLALAAQEGSPRLRVDGARLIDASGGEVLLRGVSLADPASGGFSNDHFRIIAREWKANAVRIPVDAASWKEKGDGKAPPHGMSVFGTSIGSGFPSYRLRAGFGSSVSTCEGAPFMKR
jgi:hypothetical protein